MTDVIAFPTALASGATSRWTRFAALLRRAFSHAMTAEEARPALDELPDNLLKDLGLARSEIAFVAGALARAELAPDFAPDLGPARDAADRINWRVAERDTATRLSHVALRLMVLAVAAVSAFAMPSSDVPAQDAQVARGQRLVAHVRDSGRLQRLPHAGMFRRKADMARFPEGPKARLEIPSSPCFDCRRSDRPAGLILRPADHPAIS